LITKAKGVVALVLFVSSLCWSLFFTWWSLEWADKEEDCRSIAAENAREEILWEFADIRISNLEQEVERLETQKSVVGALKTEIEAMRSKAEARRQRFDGNQIRLKKVCSNASSRRVALAWYQAILTVLTALTGFFAALWLAETGTVSQTNHAPKTRTRKLRSPKVETNA
jgi:hypothetical protein